MIACAVSVGVFFAEGDVSDGSVFSASEGGVIAGSLGSVAGAVVAGSGGDGSTKAGSLTASTFGAITVSPSIRTRFGNRFSSSNWTSVRTTGVPGGKSLGLGTPIPIVMYSGRGSAVFSMPCGFKSSGNGSGIKSLPAGAGIDERGKEGCELSLARGTTVATS